MPGFIGPVPPPLLIREYLEIVEAIICDLSGCVKHRKAALAADGEPGADVRPRRRSGRLLTRVLHWVLGAEFLTRGLATSEMTLCLVDL